MSTRSCIVRKTQRGFEGVYHHWDGYPTGLGAYLFSRFQTAKSLEDFLEQIIDKHPAGHSTLMGKEPKCYCSPRCEREPEKGWLMTDRNAAGSGCEYAYVFSEQAGVPVMEVYSSISRTGSKMIGMFGMGDEDSSWGLLGRVLLNGPKPDFKAMERKAFEDSDSFDPDQLNG